MISPNTTPRIEDQQSGNQPGSQWGDPQQQAAPVADPSAYATQPQYAQYQQPAAYPSTPGIAPGSAPAVTPVPTAGTASSDDFFARMARIVIAQPHLSLAALIGVIGAAVSVFGCFLPYVSVLGFSLNYISSGGIFVVVLMVLTAVFLFFPKKGFAITAVVLSALNVMIPLISVSAAPSFHYVAIGFYVILLGALAALFGSITQLLLITKGLLSAPQSGATAPAAAQGAPFQAPAQPVQQTTYASPVATADATVPAAAPAAYAAPTTDAQSMPVQSVPAQPDQTAQPDQQL